MFENVELKFPVDWHFRIICDSNIDISDAIIGVCREFGVNQLPKIANKSSGGKYLSYSLQVTFHDKETMHKMGACLHAISGVKIVL